jgi:hypothetical protein
MEADWEFEIASDAPVIDAAWSGLIDLRREPKRAALLPEAGKLPALADALVQLNAAGSGFWTAKCDVWEPGPIDPDEFDASSETAVNAVACYLDVLPADEQTWSTLDSAAGWCLAVCTALRARPLRQCRADLLIRSASTAPDKISLGVTVYLASCGPTMDAAETVLGTALHAFVETVAKQNCAPHPAKSYNK